jgi:RND family efflux transporter MFP subunit
VKLLRKIKRAENMQKKQIVITGGAVVGIALVLSGAVMGVKKRGLAAENAEAKRIMNQSARPVSIERVRLERSKRTYKYPGVVRASAESALSFRVGGPLVTVDFALGRPLKKGALLMRIDPRDFEDRIKSLEAQIKGAYALLHSVRQDYERTAELFNEKVVPQASYDHADSAKVAAEAALETLRIELEIARHELQDTNLVAPYDGTVTGQFVENHEMVNSGKVVLQYHNIQQLEIVINMPESAIINRNLKPGRIVNVIFSAAAGKKYKARLKEWSSTANAVARTYAVTFECEAPQEIQVFPGMSAEVILTEESSEMELSVPVAALVPDTSGGSKLWVYNSESKKAKAHRVRTGRLNGVDRIIILSGVSDGDQVVVEGSRLIVDGQILTLHANEKSISRIKAGK